MPLDPMLLNSLLGPFKNMMEECKSKNLSGEDFDKMCETYTRMEQLGQEHDDMNAFNGQIMQENLYGKFSDYYGRALSAEKKAEMASGSGNYDDAALLKTSVDALKQAIQTIKQRYEEAIQMAKGENAQEQMNMGLDYLERNSDPEMFKATGGMDALRNEANKSFNETIEKTPNAFDSSVEVEILQNPDELIKPIQDVIDLGEQPGMTLPKFLRIQIERGLDKAMEGAVVARKGLETSLEFTEVNPVSPYHIEKDKRKIVVFDELAAAQKFNVPNWKEMNMANNDIDRELEPHIIKWDKFERMWDKLIWDLSFWSLSYCSFAPFIKPWSLSNNPQEAVIKTQKTTPGLFQEWEKLYRKYFGANIYDLLKHETFEWSVKYNYISYSQEFVEFLIEKIYPECKPFNDLPTQLIEERASFYKKDRNSVDREGNPLGHMPAERMRVFYNQKFGEGRYESKYGQIVKNESQAAPWNWETFKYK